MNATSPPPVAAKRRVGGFCAAIRRIPAATLAAVVFAALASLAFAHGWIDERAATTGRTGTWSEAVAYDPATQTAELEGEVVFTPKAVSAGNFVTLKFATTLAKMPNEKSPGAVRFIYATTVNWMNQPKSGDWPPVQALWQFAELKNGEISDITRHCIYRKPWKR